ncbi:hypothetical protein ABPG77_004089 [Micractinium sp. CCAP 211/92]
MSPSHEATLCLHSCSCQLLLTFLAGLPAKFALPPLFFICTLFVACCFSFPDSTSAPQRASVPVVPAALCFHSAERLITSIAATVDCGVEKGGGGARWWAQAGGGRERAASIPGCASGKSGRQGQTPLAAGGKGRRWAARGGRLMLPE